MGCCQKKSIVHMARGCIGHYVRERLFLLTEGLFGFSFEGLDACGGLTRAFSCGYQIYWRGKLSSMVINT